MSSSSLLAPGPTLDTRILRAIHVQDVTDNERLLDTALRMAAENYSRISTGESRPDQVYERLCQDAYLSSGRARVLLATGYNPASGGIEPLGTCRCVASPDGVDRSGIAPLELMSLLEPLSGWRGFRFDGFDLRRAAELGRFAISREARRGVARDLGLPIYITRRLLETGMAVARRVVGRDQTWGIMPEYMVRRLTAAGFDLTRAPRVRLLERENAELFDAFPGYWIERSPRLYRIRLQPRWGDAG